MHETDVERHARGDYERFRARLNRAELAAAAAVSDAWLATAAASGDDAGPIEARLAAATVACCRGRLAEAGAHCDAGLDRYDPALQAARGLSRRRDPGTACLSLRARIRWLRGYPDQALADAASAVEIAQAAGHPFSLACAQLSAGLVYQWRGDTERALACGEQARDLCEEHGFVSCLGWAIMLRGWSLTTLDNGADGVADIERGQAMCHAAGAHLGRPLLLGWLAEARLRRGETETGLAHVTEALEDVATTAERWNEPELWRLRGELLRARGGDGDEDAAAAAFDAAIRVAEQLGARSWELRARTSVVRLRRVHVTLGAQLAAMAVCRQHFREGRDTADLRATDALLKMH